MRRPVRFIAFALALAAAAVAQDAAAPDPAPASAPAPEAPGVPEKDYSIFGSDHYRVLADSPSRG